MSDKKISQLVAVTSASSANVLPIVVSGVTKKITFANLNASISINLSTQTTDVLPISKGGTNSIGTLSNNRVMISNGGGIIESQYLYVDTVSASLGIGIASPTSKLHVKGVTGTGTNKVFLAESSTASNVFYIQENGISKFNGTLYANALTSGFSDYSMLIGNQSGTQFYFTGSGQLGIGTTPLNTAQVNINTTITGINIISSGYGIKSTADTCFYGLSTNGIGIYGDVTASGGTAGYFLAEHASALPIFAEMQHASTGVKTLLKLHNYGASDDTIGLSVDSYLKTSGVSSQSRLASKIITTFTTSADATRTSQFDFQLVNSAATVTVLSILANGNVSLYDGGNLVLGTTTGTKIGTSTSQKIGLWNATPIVQPTTGVGAATLVGGGGTNITDTDTFDGYTLKQIVKALRNIGVLA